ncbi:MAG: hypothetical protein U0X74_00515 [Anaerolineales bacterium]
MKINIKIKSIFLGILGSFVGAFPNMLIKLLLMFLVVYPLNWEWLIDDLFSITLLGESITVTPIGVVSYISFVGGGSFFELLFPIAGGALFGLIGMYIGYTNLRGSTRLDIEQWKGWSWWSFFGGMLFNFIFMFYFPVVAS